MHQSVKSIGKLIANATVSAAVAAAVTGVLFTGYVTQTQEEIRSRLAWKQQSVAQLLGPVNIQFDRTKSAFDRWNKKNFYLEARIIKTGNETIRNLLLEKGHLIPPELFEDAVKLVEHYDVWLELYDEQRGGAEPDLESPFVFVEPKGFGFPRDAEGNFKRIYRQYWNELYGRASLRGGGKENAHVRQARGAKES